MKIRKFEIILASIFIAFAFGWVANIVKLVGSDAGISGMDIARLAGIFIAPLGSILGLF